MSEHTENIRRAVTTGLGKLVDALDTMEKERDEANAHLENACAKWEQLSIENTKLKQQVGNLTDQKKKWLQV